MGVWIVWNLEPLASGAQSGHKLIPHIICQFLYAWGKTLNEDLFYKGSSASLPRLHTCKNKVPVWDFKEFAVTLIKKMTFYWNGLQGLIFSRETTELSEWMKNIHTNGLNKLFVIYIYIYIYMKMYRDEKHKFFRRWFYFFNYLPMLNILVFGSSSKRIIYIYISK